MSNRCMIILILFYFGITTIHGTEVVQDYCKGLTFDPDVEYVTVQRRMTEQKIKCSIQYVCGYNVTWLKDGQPVSDDPFKNFHQATVPSYSVLVVGTESNVTLTGNYTCVTTNNAMYRDLQVIISEYEIPFQPDENNLTVTEPKSQHVTCFFPTSYNDTNYGNGTSYIGWNNSNGGISESISSSVYQIKGYYYSHLIVGDNANQTGSGLYVCEVRNETHYGTRPLELLINGSSYGSVHPTTDIPETEASGTTSFTTPEPVRETQKSDMYTSTTSVASDKVTTKSGNHSNDCTGISSIVVIIVVSLLILVIIILAAVAVILLCRMKKLKKRARRSSINHGSSDESDVNEYKFVPEDLYNRGNYFRHLTTRYATGERQHTPQAI